MSPSRGVLLGLVVALATGCGPGDPVRTARLALDDPNDLQLHARGLDGSVQLSWRKGPGAAQYRVQRNTVDDFSGAVQELATSGLNRFTDASVVNGTKYHYRVLPEDGAGASTGPPSTVATAVPQAQGAAGALDTSFAASGLLSVATGTDNNDQFWRGAELPNGRIVLAGTFSLSATPSSGGILIVRVREDGTFDDSFNGTGIVQMAPANWAGTTLGDLALADDGSIVLCGSVVLLDGFTYGWLARLLPDGTPDLTFGTSGLVTELIGASNTVFSAVALERTGSGLFIAGNATFSTPDVLLLHYDAQGQRDLSWNQGVGLYMREFAEGTADDFFFDLLIDTSDRLVVAGSVRNANGARDSILARFLPDGQPDTTFGGAGNGYYRVQIYNESRYFRVAEMKGLLYTGGFSSGNGSAGEGSGPSQGFLTSRFLSNGTPDLSFDTNGYNRVDIFNPEVDQVHGLVVFPDQQSLVAGYSRLPSSDTAMLKYVAGGQADLSFGGNGLLVVNRSSGTTSADADTYQDLLWLRDGRALAIGNYNNNSFLQDMLAAKVWLTGGIPGAPCSTNPQCASGFCVDGVCCDTACGGGAATDCQACSLAAGGFADGTCGAVESGMTCRPATGSCDLAEVCDGTQTSCPEDVASPDPACPGASPDCVGLPCAFQRLSVGCACTSAGEAAGWPWLLLPLWGLRKGGRRFSGAARARS